MSGTVERRDPVEIADGVRALFLANESPGAATWFDRTFLGSSPLQGSSWVSCDPNGKVLAHITAIESRLVHAGRELRGAVLCNLMADQAHRTFFPILAVVKRAVHDLRNDGLDFAMTTSSNPGAVAVVKAAGVRQVATHQRFMLPLGDSRFPVDLLAGLHLLARRSLTRRAVARRVDAAVAAEWLLQVDATIAAVSAKRAAGQFEQRHEAFGGPHDRGYLLLDRRGTEVGAAVIQTAPTDATALVISLRCRSADALPGSVLAIGAALRADGLRRLSLLAVEGSAVARGFVRGGCLQRHEPCVIAGIGFTDAGRAAMAAVGDSDLERMDFD
jgi:hypothetical protein